MITGYNAWSVVAFEVPTTAKWNILGANDAAFYSKLTGIPFILGDNAVGEADSPADAVLRLQNADAVSTRFYVDSYGQLPVFQMRRWNGTSAAKTALLENDFIGAIAFSGYGTSAMSSSRATIYVAAAEDWTDTAHGTMIRTYITKIGTSGAVEAFRLSSDGIPSYTFADTFVNSNFAKTSNTTLGDITGLTADLLAGRRYSFVAKLYTTSNVGGGVKVAIDGTCTATSIVYEGLTSNAGLTTQSRGAALGNAVGAVTAVTVAYIEISGTILVNAAGTLTVQFAQNASNAAASTVLANSTFVVRDIT